MNKLPMLAAVALLLSGCGGGHDGGGDRGPVVSERRDVGSFDSISLEGAAKLEIRIGEPLSVQVSGNERTIGRTETRVSGGTLHIKNKVRDWGMLRNNTRLTVKITLPELQSLEVEGGNDVSVAGLHGGDTAIKAAGATNIIADGQLDELTVRLAGAGHADLSKLAVADAKVTVDGVGSVIVNPQESLDATMNGVGAIFYTGSPRKVNTRMNGLGTIARQDSNQGSSEPKVESEQPPAEPDSLELEREDPKQEPVDHKEGRIIVI
ncbi:head GIN domain-containing protein [Peristeroidobacter agariperforans]|uniref:head GIN domain-containing protein n=1 Tax=Peristeroidobacter agariperforans TaxID=268404 RepID=UPI00101CDA52|nr:head GIN domain-containing protein [Peristeroidobacter agariperforans]